MRQAVLADLIRSIHRLYSSKSAGVACRVLHSAYLRVSFPLQIWHQWSSCASNMQDLEIIFSRFGNITSCDIIKDWKTGDSLCYAFLGFDSDEACEEAYFKMNNCLIDDRRIKVIHSHSLCSHPITKRFSVPLRSGRCMHARPCAACTFFTTILDVHCTWQWVAWRKGFIAHATPQPELESGTLSGNLIFGKDMIGSEPASQRCTCCSSLSMSATEASLTKQCFGRWTSRSQCTTCGSSTDATARRGVQRSLQRQMIRETRSGVDHRAPCQVASSSNRALEASTQALLVSGLLKLACMQCLVLISVAIGMSWHADGISLGRTWQHIHINWHRGRATVV